MGARIVIQLLRIFLMHRQYLIENDFILAVEPGNLRDQGIEFCRIVRRGRVDQRGQAFIAIGEPGIVIVLH